MVSLSPSSSQILGQTHTVEHWGPTNFEHMCLYRVSLVHFLKMSLNPVLSFAVIGEMKLKFLFVF